MKKRIRQTEMPVLERFAGVKPKKAGVGFRTFNPSTFSLSAIGIYRGTYLYSSTPIPEKIMAGTQGANMGLMSPT